MKQSVDKVSQKMNFVNTEGVMMTKIDLEEKVRYDASAITGVWRSW